MARGRRIRGIVLRLVLNRRIAIAAGAAIASPAVVVLANDYAWETGVTDGLVLVAAATGLAILWAGISGRTADWID